MKREWVIPAMLVAGMTALAATTYAASAQGGDWRDAPGHYHNGYGPHYWQDQKPGDDDDYGPRWRRGDRYDRGYDRDADDDYGQQGWRDDRRGYGQREGRSWRDCPCGGCDRDRGGYGWRDRGRGYDDDRDDGRQGRDYGRNYDRDYDRGDDRRDRRSYDRDDSDRGMRQGGRGGPGRFGQGYPGYQGFDPARLDSIKREIGVTPAQEAAWTKFTTTLKEASDARRARRDNFDRSAVSRMSADDFRKFRDTMIQQRRKEQDSVLAAEDDFVKTLDEKQVAIAREVLPGYALAGRMEGMGMGQGMGQGMGPGMGGQGMGPGMGRGGNR